MKVRGTPERPGRRAQLPLVLFVCHTNTTLSIMAEAILQHLAEGRVRAASAGDMPAVQVNPCASECLRAHGVAMRCLRSKPWGEFFGLHRQPVRLVIALNEGYASQVNWGGDTLVARWEMPDPAGITGSKIDIRLAFEEAFETLQLRIRKFLALPMAEMTDDALLRELVLIGKEA